MIISIKPVHQQHAGACRGSGGSQGQPWRCGGPWPSWPAACWPGSQARRCVSLRRPGCSTSLTDSDWSGAEYEWNARCSRLMPITRHLRGFTMAVKETIVFRFNMKFLPFKNQPFLSVIWSLIPLSLRSQNILWYSVKVAELPASGSGLSLS